MVLKLRRKNNKKMKANGKATLRKSYFRIEIKVSKKLALAHCTETVCLGITYMHPL